MLFNIEDGILNEGNSRFRMDAVLTIANDKIFKGYSTSTFDLLYTVRNGKLYPADSRFSLDVLYTFKDGVIYQGDSTFALDALYTLHQGGVYKGNSHIIFDRLFMISGTPSVPEVFALLMALDLLWLGLFNFEAEVLHDLIGEQFFARFFHFRFSSCFVGSF